MKRYNKNNLELLHYETFEKEFSCHINKISKEQEDKKFAFVAAIRPSGFDVNFK